MVQNWFFRSTWIRVACTLLIAAIVHAFSAHSAVAQQQGYGSSYGRQLAPQKSNGVRYSRSAEPQASQNQVAFVPTHERASGRVVTRSNGATQGRRSIVTGQEMVGSGAVAPAGSVQLASATECATCQTGGEVYYDGPVENFGGEVVGGDVIGCDTGCGSCGVCDGYGDCDSCGRCPSYRLPTLVSFADMEYSVGVQGVKGPMNLGQSGSFGLNQSVNWGFPSPIFNWAGLSGQLGVRFVESNFAGTGFANDPQDQAFITGGFHRRADYGLQLGMVFDYLDEKWYFNGKYAQLRGQLSWVNSYGNEWGFRFAYNTHNTDGLAGIINQILPQLGNPNNTFIPMDQYRFFHRHHLQYVPNGTIDVFAGWAASKKAIVGTDLLLPLTDNFAVQTGFVTVIVDSENNVQTNQDESWNIYSNIVWYPKGLNRWSRAYHRPMFDVADNGTLLMAR
jgi:hypothetical protein